CWGEYCSGKRRALARRAIQGSAPRQLLNHSVRISFCAVFGGKPLRTVRLLRRSPLSVSNKAASPRQRGKSSMTGARLSPCQSAKASTSPLSRFEAAKQARGAKVRAQPGGSESL